MKEDSLHHSSAHTGADATDSGSRAASDRPHIFGSQNALKVFCTNSVYTFLPDESGMNSISPTSRSQALDDQVNIQIILVIDEHAHSFLNTGRFMQKGCCLISPRNHQSSHDSFVLGMYLVDPPTCSYHTNAARSS